MRDWVRAEALGELDRLACWRSFCSILSTRVLTPKLFPTLITHNMVLILSLRTIKLDL